MNATDTRDVESDVLVTGAGLTGPVVDVVAARSALGHSTFDDMLALFKKEIYRYAVHLTRDHVEANDLYQETLLEAYHAFDQLERTTNYRTRLFSLATSVFMNDRHMRSHVRPIDEERAGEIPGATMEAFVAALPRNQRVALVQRMFHNLSYAEIADSLGCSETAARDRVYTALRTLRDHFGDRL